MKHTQKDIIKNLDIILLASVYNNIEMFGSRIILAVTAIFALIVPFSADTVCPTVTSPNADRRTDKNTLRIMQYNVEWLFTDYYKNADCPGENCTWKNETAAQTHLTYVANVINDVL